MKNPMIILVILAVVAILGVGAYAFSQDTAGSDLMVKQDENTMPKEDTSTEPADAVMQKEDTSMESEKMIDTQLATSRYIQHSELALDNASGNRRVLFFYASWCPTCKPADASFTQNVSRIPDDVTLIRVNYNDPETDQLEKDLAKKYAVTYQHTFVQIDETGKEVAKWNGGQIDELLSNIK